MTTNDLIVRPTTTSVLAEVDPANLKSTARMVKAMVTGAYGKEMNETQALQLAFISLTTGLNPLTGELYMTDTGPQIGVLAYERKASEYLDAYLPGTDYHVQYREARPGIDADFDPEKGDIGYVAILTRDDWDDKWRKAYRELFQMYTQSGMDAAVADSLTRQHVGPKPCSEYVGVVDHRESFSGEYKAGGSLPDGAKAGDKKPEMMDRHERAKKRARKGVIKHEFPRMDIPDPLAVLAGGQNLIKQAMILPETNSEAGRPAHELISEIVGQKQPEQEKRIDVTPEEPPAPPEQETIEQRAPMPRNGKPKIEQGGPLQWLIDEGLADNVQSAAGMANYLKFGETTDRDEQRELAQVYRAWRAAGVNAKDAAAHTLAGELPDEAPETEAETEPA